MHPADQHIECPTCGTTFPRAGAYTEHVENGRCKGITKSQFADAVREQLITKELMKDVSDSGVDPDLRTENEGSRTSGVLDQEGLGEVDGEEDLINFGGSQLPPYPLLATPPSWMMTRRSNMPA